MNDLTPTKRKSLFRKKITVEVELVMNDGDTIGGMVFVDPGERIQDLLNGSMPFMPVRLANDEIIIVRKDAIAVCKPLDLPG